MAALLSGDVDYITHNSRIVATAVRGGGVKSVFNYVARPIYYLVTLPEIKQPKELQGRTVGVSLAALHITSLSSYWSTMALMLQGMSLSAPLGKTLYDFQRWLERLFKPRCCRPISQCDPKS